MVSRSQFDFNLLRSLEVFAAVVETRQVTKAAKLLGITQSAASQHLGNLEKSFGVQLLDRSARPIELTRAGISLHRRAIRILNEVEDLSSELRHAENMDVPLLRIATLPSIATTLTSTLVALGRDRFGASEISIFASMANDHQDLLRNRRADMVVTSDALYDVDGLERHGILREDFLLVTPPDHDGQISDLQTLSQDLPLVRFNATTPVGRLTNQHLRRLRLDLRFGIEADRSSIIIAAVSAGQGFAILTPTLLLDGLAEGLRVDVTALPVTRFSRTLTLVAREGELGLLPEAAAVEISGCLLAAIQDRLGVLPLETVVT